MVQLTALFLFVKKTFLIKHDELQLNKTVQSLSFFFYHGFLSTTPTTRKTAG